MSLAEAVARWMREQVAAANARGLVVGLSGDLNSAVVARLAQLASPSAALGVIFPCHDHPEDERDAELVANHFTLATARVDLSSAYDALVRDVQAAAYGRPNVPRAPAPPPDPAGSRVPHANLLPRLRMTALYFFANSLTYLVAGTGNRSDLAIGAFTKHGEGAADLLPLGHLVQRDVRLLARELDVPAPILDRPPAPGRWREGAATGFSYADLDRYLEQGPQAVAPAVAMQIERLARASEHKRQLAATPELD